MSLLNRIRLSRKDRFISNGVRVVAPRARLLLKSLEERCVPAQLLVTDAGDTGPNTLRGVMATADGNGEDDTITFQAGITTINLTSGQIGLTTQNNLLTIDGGGVVTINGAATPSATNRIFSFNVSGGNPTITLQNLTLAKGNLSSGNNGGAILLNNDPLTLNNVTFDTNMTASGGGAIATTSGSVSANINITNGAFTNNFSGGVGACIFSLGAMTLTLSGTSVSNSTSTGTGGFLQANGASTVTIDSASFSGNVSNSSSGAPVILGSGGTWIITNSTFSGNQAPNGFAGNISISGGTFNMSNCSLINNTSKFAGGALRLMGTSMTATIDSCTLSGNTATSSTGGAIDFYPSSGVGSLSITNSTISGNSAAGNGGGIDLRIAGTGSAVITNSTITGNTSGTSDGGGVADVVATGTAGGSLTINNCTITGNSAGGSGGGIRKLSVTGSGALTINSSIVAGNSATSGPDISSSSTISLSIGGSHNVIGVADVGGFTLSGANRTGTLALPLDAKVNALASNGAPATAPLTQSLQAGSPAHDFGTNLLSLPFDERGTSFPRVNGAVPDVGAFESVTTIPEAKATLPSVTPAGTTYVATVVYTDETGINTSTIDVNDVVLSGPGGYSASPTMAAFTGSSKSVTATYTFTPPGGSWDWTDDGLYTLTMRSTTPPNQVSDTDGPNAVPGGVLEVLPVTVALPIPLVVNNQGDGDDGNYTAGQLTLREAVRLSNFTAGQTDSITFAAGLTGKTIAVGSLIVITDPVSITGLGAANLTLSGSDANQIFGVSLANGTGTVNVNQMTIAHGNATAGRGGAISVDNGNLTMSSVTLDSNQSTLPTLGGGGAISINPAAKLTFNNCTMTNNSDGGTTGANFAGGGVVAAAGAATVTLNSCNVNNNSSGVDGGGVIHSEVAGFSLVINDSTITNNTGVVGGVGHLGGGSTVTIARSTISNNTATTGSSLVGGGAFFTFAQSGATFSADSSLFANNSAASGGAIYTQGGTTTLTNCTLDGNTATGNGNGGGGAIFVTQQFTNLNTLTLNNCTVTGNVATSGGGGGIKKYTTNANNAKVTIALNSNIVATNTSASGGADIDCAFSTAVAGGANLVGIADKGNFSLATTNGANKTGLSTSMPPGLDPTLSPLANNGGPTYTRALIAGSPAFNSGYNPSPMTVLYDQRGMGYPRLLQTAVDIGAFEGINPVPAYSGTLANVPPINATYKASVTYTSPVGINTGIGSINVNDVRLSGPGYGMTPATPISATVTAGSNGAKSVTVEYVFTPPSGTWDYTDDGTYQLDVQANQVYDTNPVPLSAPAGKVNSFLVAIPLPVLVVDNVDDVDDGDYSAGNFTLREAINRANAAVGTSDTITFSPSLNGQTISLFSNTSLDITDPLTITGPGAANLTISGANGTRVFFANIATVGSAISISGLTIADGNKTGGSGLWITNENATVNNCVFSNNFNNAAAGAIYVNNTAATLNVNNCTFDSNSSQGGGAITTGANAGLFVNNSLFTNNYQYSGNSGGAIRYVGTGGPANVAIRNSTFAGNKSNYSGGAIGFISLSGTALIQNCTIDGNIANFTDAFGGVAGGISIIGASGSKVILDSCIVSGNVTGSNTPVADDLQNSGGEIDANFSLLGNTANATNFVPDTKTTLLLGQNPMLDVLASNGGPTQTMRLLPGSPAINNGSNPAGLAHDQRGNTRSIGQTDIGAYEVQPSGQLLAQPNGIVIQNGDIQRSMVKTVKVTFNQHVGFSGAGTVNANAAAAFTLNRVSDNAPVTLAAVVDDSGSGTAVTLTFSGGAVDNASLKDGRYAFHILGSTGFIGDGFNGSADFLYDEPASPAALDTGKIFRIFGDANGDGAVAVNDFVGFRGAFGAVLTPSNDFFDFDGDGAVSVNDFIQFRSRFNSSI
jgi:predicted outer membrane repeat protein